MALSRTSAMGTNGPIHVSGVGYVLHALQAMFSSLEQEINIRSISEWESFARMPGENIDQASTSFELEFKARRTICDGQEVHSKTPS